jgi:large conductance mechanosensitive channel
MLGGVDFSDLSVTVKEGVAATATTEAVDAVTINYGMFMNTGVDFVIVAFAIFVMVKLMNKMMKMEAAKPAPPPGPTPDKKLHMENRDASQSKS